MVKCKRVGCEVPGRKTMQGFCSGLCAEADRSIRLKINTLQKTRGERERSDFHHRLHGEYLALLEVVEALDAYSAEVAANKQQA